MPLSQNHLQDVCMLHCGDSRQCRYLAEDDDNPNKWYCLKKRKTDKDMIDQRVNQFVKDCQRKNVDPHSQNIPMGDNCGGYPILKVIDQGYDCDGL